LTLKNPLLVFPGELGVAPKAMNLAKDSFRFSSRLLASFPRLMSSLAASPEHVVIFSTAPSKEVADKITRALLEEKLVACVSHHSVKSTYWWDGKIEEGEEVQLLMKTTSTRVEEVEKTLKRNHPYEVPEFLVTPVIIGSKEYLGWISASTTR